MNSKRRGQRSGEPSGAVAPVAAAAAAAVEEEEEELEAAGVVYERFMVALESRTQPESPSWTSLSFFFNERINLQSVVKETRYMRRIVSTKKRRPAP